MIISERWLRQWISIKLDTPRLAQTLTLAGLEVGAVIPLPDLENVVVGEIIAISPHPNADRLHVCQVEVGKAKPLTIVCGAANAAQGIRVPTALAGAVLPSGATISKAAVRGITSDGMLCSAAELGLAESAEGLLILDRTTKIGTALNTVLDLPDHLLEIDLTPNRGDCLSIAGIARELAAVTAGRLKRVNVKPVAIKSKRKVTVTVRTKADCPRYVGRAITGISPEARTPLWMQERLRRSGVRSIHPVVDVTNYVMLELGQPMHAFDLERLSGGIEVRHARQGETLRLLDGSDLDLEVGSLLIADRSRPLALAGVMGGVGSAVSEATRDIFLESAYFKPETISRFARAYGLHTDSSHRFERGVDPALQREALEHASELLLSIVGGIGGPITEAVARSQLPTRPTVLLRKRQLARLLGIELLPSKVMTILVRLGMTVRPVKEGWRVTPPSYRFDIREECDLIEEVARAYGYAQLPTEMPSMCMGKGTAIEQQLPAMRLRTALVDRGYQEIITYGFVDPELQAALDPGIVPARLANPIASNMSVMRTNLWPGLVQAVVYNQNRQQSRVRVFEIGARFLSADGNIAEEALLAGAVTGTTVPEQWGEERRSVDFFDVKGDVEALLALTGEAKSFRFSAAHHPVLHPGQTAEITRAGEHVGWIGRLHPEIEQRLGLDQPAFVFELLSSKIQAAIAPIFHEISRFPSIRRDLAIIVGQEIPAQAVLDTIGRVAGDLLVNLELFDEYRGEGIDSGRKSLAMALTLQDFSRTLNEEAVENTLGKVVSALQAEYGAQLRQ